ncbi:MAG: hypothetical protein ACLRIS_12250 [Flavonifractor plautii]
MFQNDYRREMDGLRPSPAAVERLNRLLEKGRPGGPAAGPPGGRGPGSVRCPVRHRRGGGPHPVGRAGGPPGALRPLCRRGGGETSGQGLRLELVKAVSDGYTARVYYTLTDETGDRLNGHTQVSGG